MKPGLTLTQMAAKVEAQIAQKRDYVVESDAIAVFKMTNHDFILSLQFFVTDYCFVRANQG
jgi:hypothetical protein